MKIAVTFDSAYYPYYPIMGIRTHFFPRRYLRYYLKSRLKAITSMVRVGGTTQDFQYYSQTLNLTLTNATLSNNQPYNVTQPDGHCLVNSSCPNNICDTGQAVRIHYDKDVICPSGPFTFEVNDLYNLTLSYGQTHKKYFCPYRWVNATKNGPADRIVMIKCTSGQPEVLVPFQQQYQCNRLPTDNDWELSIERCKSLFVNSSFDDITNYSHFAGLEEFFKESDTNYIFGANAFYGQPHPDLLSVKRAAPINISNILSVVDSYPFSHMTGVSIGNEVNTYFNGSEQAYALKQLRDDATAFSFIPYGPDGHSQAAGGSAPQQPYIQDFLKNAPEDTIFSFHSYSLNNTEKGGFDYGNNCDGILVKKWLTNFETQNKHLLAWAREERPNIQVVGSEIGPNNKGGRLTCNSAYANSFWYATMLGQAAKMNISVIYRQTFFSKTKGNEDDENFAAYPLLLACMNWTDANCYAARNWESWLNGVTDTAPSCNNSTYTSSHIAPLPDYYIAYLWNKLMTVHISDNTDHPHYISYTHEKWSVYINYNDTQSADIVLPEGNTETYSVSASQLTDQIVQINGVYFGGPFCDAVPDQPIVYNGNSFTLLPQTINFIKCHQSCAE